MSLHDRIKDIFFPDPDLSKLNTQVSLLKSQLKTLIGNQGRTTAEWVEAKDSLRADMIFLRERQEKMRLATLDLNRRLEALEGAHADT